jgi:hypothetical protein
VSESKLGKMMHNYALLWMLFLVLPVWADDFAIENIRQTYTQIHSSLPSLKASEFESGLQSTEGVQAVKHQDQQGKIKLIKLTVFGEMGNNLSEYYYQDQQVVFVLTSERRYNAPIYLNATKAKELGIAAFDPKKTTLTENRYYFKAEQLLRWLDNNKYPIKSSEPRFKREAKRVLSESKKLLTKAKN